MGIPRLWRAYEEKYRIVKDNLFEKALAADFLDVIAINKM